MSEVLVATWSGGSTFVQINMSQGGQNTNGNWTDVPWNAVVRDTHGSVSGTWDWNRNVAGETSSGSIGAGTGTRTLAYGTKRITHDTNGNASISASAYLDVYYGQNTAYASMGLTRIALAPTISSNTSSNITTNSATIAGAVNSNGHGTSTTITYFYRVSGVGSYTNAGTGSSKALTSLHTNTTYQWYITATNNMGDVATGGVQTFKTKSGVKVILPNGTVEDRVVKQILPTGVVTERVVIKVS